MKITIESEDLERQLKAAIKADPEETAKAMTDIVLDLAGESAERAPIESGDLRNDCSADINGVQVYVRQAATGAEVSPGAKVSGSVGYSLPYALRQHEDLTLRHDRTDGRRIMSGKNAGRTVNMVAGGEAKYLERPFNERLPKYLERLEQIVEDTLKT